MNVTDLLEAPSPDSPRRKSRRFLSVAVAGVVLAVLGTMAYLGFRSDSTETGPSASASRQQAKEALAAFLSATSPEGRAAHVISGDRLLPLMQAWYASHENESLSAEAFQEPGWTFSNPSESLFALECRRGRGLPPVVACFTKSDTGVWLLDWEIWTQTLDSQFRKFINRPAEGEHILRARLARSNSGPEMSLTLTDPFDVDQTLSFDITRPDLLALYNRDLPEAGSRTATVQLVWLNNPLTGTLTPDLRRHVCWGFPGLDGKEPEMIEINLPSKHRPPPGTPAVAPSILATARQMDAAVKTAIAPTGKGSLSPRPAEVDEVMETAQK
jgi:hypothetical protein